MANSTSSYEDRIGKFKAGNTLIQGWVDYDPTNELITQAGSTAFVASVDAANDNVTLSKNTMGEAKDDRKLLSFTLYDDNEEVGIINPNCAEQRIIRTYSYMEGILPEGNQKLETIAGILKKIRPRYKGPTTGKSYSIEAGETIAINKLVSGKKAKNTGNTTLEWRETGMGSPWETIASKQEITITAPGGSIEVKNPDEDKNGKLRVVIETGNVLLKSPSEKTFASLPAFLMEVIKLVQTIDPAIYAPPDPLITEEELITLYDQLIAANNAVTNAMDAYGEANRTRKELYDSTDGMKDRIRLTKSYLGSFSGGKKSNHYIEYTQAIKGT